MQSGSLLNCCLIRFAKEDRLSVLPFIGLIYLSFFFTFLPLLISFMKDRLHYFFNV